MSPLKIFLPLLVLVGLSSALLGGYQGEPGAQSDLPQIYCGRTLSRIIANLCFDVPIDNDKRSRVATMYGALIPEYYKEQENHVDWPWASHKSTALGSLRGKRFIGGVADECCEKPCSTAKLLLYC